MRFEFDSINELAEFFDFCKHLARLDPGVANYPQASALPELAMPEISREESIAQREEQDAKNAAFVAETVEQNAAAEPQKRKRRTKAEMEAARAAEPHDQSAPAQHVPEPAAANPFAQTNIAAEILAKAEEKIEAAIVTDITDAADFIKSRLSERPEVSQVDHLNMARTFIGKHGMDKYNQSFALAGLTNNVMGYSTADCATHAAALDFLSLE